MKIDLKSSWTGEIIFSCEVEADTKRVGRGLAVMKALKTHANLTGADLTHAVLARANLARANLAHANLAGAVLTHANLTHANLTGADLTHANLTHANLTGADLTHANLTGADLTHAVLAHANLHSGIPIIPNIHRALYEKLLPAVNGDGTPKILEMDQWHTCKTTHCRAGHIVNMAGAAGACLEGQIGTGPAAALIYQVSDPGLSRIPNWYATNQEAWEDIQRLGGALE